MCASKTSFPAWFRQTASIEAHSRLPSGSTLRIVTSVVIVSPENTGRTNSKAQRAGGPEAGHQGGYGERGNRRRRIWAHPIVTPICTGVDASLVSTAAGLLEAEKQFRGVNGFREMEVPRRALGRQTPGGAPVSNVA